MNDEQPETPWEFKPGDTITPGSSPAGSPPPQAEAAAPTPVEPAESQVAPAESIPLPAPQPAVVPQAPVDGQEAITWTASEFIEHTKSANWYVALGGVAAIVAAIIFLLTKDKIATGVVVVAALALGVYGKRQPRQLDYSLDEQGLTIASKFFPYESFRSFAVMDEDAFSSIAFLPLRRFGPLTTIYYDPQDEAAIVDLLSQRLPLEPRQHDLVDRFMKKIKF